MHRKHLGGGGDLHIIGRSVTTQNFITLYHYTTDEDCFTAPHTIHMITRYKCTKVGGVAIHTTFSENPSVTLNVTGCSSGGQSGTHT
jgi:hypothetical protein